MALAQREITVTTNDLTHWSQRASGTVATEWWVDADGTTVAYMKTLTYPDEQYAGVRFVLCDIEVRTGHRGQGFARTIIEQAEAATGLTLHSNGGYTPLGAAAFAGRMPVKPGHDEGVKWNDMTFVQDWDTKRGPS